MQQFKDHLLIAAATLVMFLVFESIKPDWAPAWAPVAGAACILAGLLWGNKIKQKEAAARKERQQREERAERLEMEKHRAEPRHQAEKEEQKRDSGRVRPEFVRALQTPAKEGNGQSASPA